MNVFISGGCKNGKSYIAQGLARDMARRQGKPLYYIATMIPRDREDHARVRRHVAERAGWGFTTIEQGVNLTAVLQRGDVDPSGVFLLDSVTALLGNEMFGEDGTFDPQAERRVREQAVAFAEKTGNTVFVSDYIYGDPWGYSETTEAYRKALAGIDRALAAACRQVVEVAYGVQERWK